MTPSGDSGCFFCLDSLGASSPRPDRVFVETSSRYLKNPRNPDARASPQARDALVFVVAEKPW